MKLPSVSPAAPLVSRDRALACNAMALLVIGALWAVQVGRNLAVDLRFEDALIVLRYARNLTQGLGFVFNPGERVLGVATPLYTLLSTVFVALGGESAPVLQNLAGLFFLLGEAGVVLLLLHRSGYAWVALPVALATLGNYNLNYLYLGMEVHLFALLVLLAFYLHQRQTAPIRVGLLLGVAFLVRYDAALAALVIGIDLWLRRLRPPHRLVLGFLLPVLPWLVFAQLYFGSILPSPLAAKQGHGPAGHYLLYVLDYYRQTLEQLLRFAFHAAHWSRPLSFVAGATLLWGVFAARRRRTLLLLAAYAPLHVLAYALIGSDPAFTWHYYLLNPIAFAFLGIGVCETLRLAWRSVPRWLRRGGSGRIAAAAVLILALAAQLVGLARHSAYRYRLDPHSSQLFEMATWMRNGYPPETSLLQPSIGVLGWITGFRMIDPAGLVTPGLHYHDAERSTPIEEVVRRFAPDLVLLTEWDRVDPRPLGYEVVRVFDSRSVYTLYERVER